MSLEPEIIAALSLVSMLAAFVDAIAGGGGLITVPALLFAGVPPVAALGTNKLQSSLGTSIACLNYFRRGLIDWRANRALVLLVFFGAAGGTWAVQSLNPHLLQIVVPFLLVAVTAYVLLSPRMSDEDAHERLSRAGYAPLAGGIGFYDGFFGPGTGAFFTASLVALRGHGLTRAAALAKLFNLTSNLASLLAFALGGSVLWLLGACMATGAVAGGWLGSHMAIRFGARIIRPLLVTISLALTARLLWGYWVR